MKNGIGTFSIFIPTYNSFLERAHVVIVYTVSMSNAVWATLGSRHLFSGEARLTLLDAPDSADLHLQKLSPLCLGCLCRRGCLLVLGGSAAWKLQASLESVHLESMWLIYLPDFLPRQNVRTGRDIGGLWIQHFISQVRKARLRKGRQLSKGSIASAGQWQPSCFLRSFPGCLTTASRAEFYRNPLFCFYFSAYLSGCPSFYIPSLGGNT